MPPTPLPHAGKGWGWGGSGGIAERESGGDGVENAVALAHHDVIGKTEEAVTALLQGLRPAPVVGEAVVMAMLVTVEFDDRTVARAREVGGMVFDRDLTAEMRARYRKAMAKMPPPSSFDVRRLPAKLLGVPGRTGGDKLRGSLRPGHHQS
jgi:hypothetical protein